MRNSNIAQAGTIRSTILGVLRRPRFGITVSEPFLDRYQHDTWSLVQNGYEYNLKFLVNHHRTSVSVMASPTAHKEFFFYRSVDHRKMPNLRLVGLTIANKIKMRVFHDISGS